MTTTQVYQRFLAEFFPGLQLRAPLFYNWPRALRFDLQTRSGDPEAYFREVQRRATALCEAAFAPTDTALLVLMERAYRRRKIRFGNFCFRQIADLQRQDVSYAHVQHRYELDRFDAWNGAAIELKASRLQYPKLLQAIANQDYPLRQPQLSGTGVLSYSEVYLLNLSRQLIFHMYDDRGLDILAADLDALQPLYQQFNGWLLDHDRAEMATRMGGSPG